MYSARGTLRGAAHHRWYVQHGSGEPAANYRLQLAVLLPEARVLGSYDLEVSGTRLTLPAAVASERAAVKVLVSRDATAGLIAAFGVSVGFYLFAIAVLVMVLVILADVYGGDRKSCGGISTCSSPDYIKMIAFTAVMLALLVAGAAGNFLALGLSLLMLHDFFKRGP